MGFKIGEVAGIRIELHFTFIIIIIAILLMLLFFNPTGILAYSLFLFFLFGSVLFHELVHSIVATNRGMKVKKIILLPIGGIAFTEGLLKNPSDELRVAIAGPLFNFLLVIVALIVGQFLGIPFFIDFESIAKNNPLNMLIWINLILGVFNLMPALPLDGGRVARALLSRKIGELNATRAIIKFSLFFSAFLFIVGLLSANIIIAAVAVFLFFGAQQEREVVEIKHLLTKFSTKDAIVKPKMISSKATVAKAIENMVKEKTNYLIIKEKNSYKILTLGMLANSSKNASVKSIARELKTIDYKKPLSELFLTIIENSIPVVGVKKRGKLIGVVDINAIRLLAELSKIKE
ncbi:MAG: site-2 protease family protein [Candidatus Diapherotrites archaeon]|nr:site-2 protease family protein [Candidatus Diapherotrites archaeon]